MIFFIDRLEHNSSTFCHMGIPRVSFRQVFYLLHTQHLRSLWNNHMNGKIENGVTERQQFFRPSRLAISWFYALYHGRQNSRIFTDVQAGINGRS